MRINPEIEPIFLSIKHQLTQIYFFTSLHDLFILIL